MRPTDTGHLAHVVSRTANRNVSPQLSHIPSLFLQIPVLVCAIWYLLLRVHAVTTGTILRSMKVQMSKKQCRIRGKAVRETLLAKRYKSEESFNGPNANMGVSRASFSTMVEP